MGFGETSQRPFGRFGTAIDVIVLLDPHGDRLSTAPRSVAQSSGKHQRPDTLPSLGHWRSRSDMGRLGQIAGHPGPYRIRDEGSARLATSEPRPHRFGSCERLLRVLQRLSRTCGREVQLCHPNRVNSQRRHHLSGRGTGREGESRPTSTYVGNHARGRIERGSSRRGNENGHWCRLSAAQLGRSKTDRARSVHLAEGLSPIGSSFIADSQNCTQAMSKSGLDRWWEVRRSTSSRSMQLTTRLSTIAVDQSEPRVRA